VRKVLNRIIKIIVSYVGALLHTYNKHISRITLPKFANKQSNLNIPLPRTIKNPEYIHIGDDVTLGPYCSLKATTEYRYLVRGSENKIEEHMQKFHPIIRIGNRVSATAGLQIAALMNITIEDDVMFAANIFMCDAQHGYESTDIPYIYQPMGSAEPITIKKGCWIGQNVTILPGVTIGEFCIIGANSVVTKSIPEKTIAFGNPAKVIKRWDSSQSKWVSI
jgi:acetyltransferase-like isoleucine patch superfamily enzyme